VLQDFKPHWSEKVKIACRFKIHSARGLAVGGIDPYTLMAPHGPRQTRWPNSLERVVRISELLGELCGGSRDYLMIKET
jgi:hypothetical protein